MELLKNITNNVTLREFEKYKKRNTEHYSYYNSFHNKHKNTLPHGLEEVPIPLLPYVHQMYELQQNTGEFNIEEDDEEVGVFTLSFQPNSLQKTTSLSDTSINPTTATTASASAVTATTVTTTTLNEMAEVKDMSSIPVLAETNGVHNS